MLSLLKNSEVRISDFLDKPSAVLQGSGPSQAERRLEAQTLRYVGSGGRNSWMYI